MKMSRLSMRRLVPCMLLLLVALCGNLRAQEATAAQSGARLIDEFGDILISDWLARADNFAIELQTTPTTKGYIVAYGVPNKFPGWPLRRSQQIKGYLIASRGLDAARVEVINGGYRDVVLFQLWAVEAGAQLPVPPFDFGAALSREKTPFLFDRYGYIVPDPEETGIESGYIGYLSGKALYEPFVTALNSDPSARGCIIVYKAARDRRGTDKRLAARVKRAIHKWHAIGVERVVALGGGSRAQQSVELWLVPPGSPLPKPTPETPPARRRRRR